MTKTKVEMSHDELFKRMAQNIERGGRQIVGVSGTTKEPPFVYTIGNQEKLLPELLFIGNLSAVETSAMLNELSQHMIDQKQAWSLGEHTLGAYLFRVYDGGSEAKAKYTYQAGQFYNNQDYKVLQIVLPDKNTRWPDDPLCHKAFKVPILGLTGNKLILR